MSEIQDVDQAPRVSEGKKNISTKSSVQDDIQLSTESFFYTWTVSNFLECLKFRNAKIISPEFEFAGANWRLWLRAICKNDKLEKVKIRLVRSEKCDSGHHIKRKFSFLNEDGSYVTKEATSSFHDELVWSHWLSFKYHEKSKKCFIIQDKLTVNCELLVLSSSLVNTVPKSHNQSAKKAINLSPSCGHNVSSGMIRSHLRSRTPKAVKKPLSTYARSSLKMFRKAFGTISTYLSVFILLNVICLIFNDETNRSRNSSLNMTEINELIVDSTLKIINIAEALNLTDIKIKSSELLACYHKDYNISERNFTVSRDKILAFMIPDQILNASIPNIFETAIKKIAEFINNEQ